MNNRTSLQQLQHFLLVPSLFALVLATPNVASAIELKYTNYRIPKGAYFVSPNGKSNNTGKSPRSPWTVEKAIRQAPRGSTIVFRGGIYRNVDVGIRKRLTLQAYPYEKPWLKGSIEVKGWVNDGSMWRKDGWKYSFPLIDSKHIDPEHPMAIYRDMVYIDGVSLKQVGRKAQVGPGKFYIDHASNKLYIGNNPAGKILEATVLPNAFGLWENLHSNPGGTVIRGLGFAQYADRALTVGAARVKLENNTIVWNGFAGVTLSVEGNNAVIRGNTFSYNGCVGIGGQADGLLLEGNTISHNNIEHCRKSWGAAGVKFFKTSGSLVRNNLIENNYATGIWFDVSSLSNTIANNFSRHNEGIGIFYELSHKALITGNMVSNNSAGIMLADSSGSQVSNNTLINNKGKDPIILKDSSRLNKNRAEMAKGIMWITRNNVVRDNNMN